MTARVWYLLGYAEIGEILNIRPESVRMLRFRGQLPDPDQIVSNAPLWLPETIEEWIRGNRPDAFPLKPLRERPGFVVVR